MQLAAMRAYAKRKGWQVGLKIEDIGSGAVSRPRREELLRAARRKEIDKGFAQRDKAHLQRHQFLQRGDQIDERPAPAVEPPHDDGYN
jgi:DNA invertase Pin-like site-specific DNA recombinase